MASLSPGSGHAAPARSLTSVTIAMGYIPNVQFAPFYVAQARGYYRQAGLDVHFNYGIEPDILRLLSEGKVDFADSGGDEVVTAGAHGLHVKYVLTQYSRFSSALFSLQKAGIKRPADLRGKTVGVPYTFGASYVGLLALLQRNGVPRASVTIRSIGFTQVAAVAQRKVDAAVGFAMNEPVQLREQGYKVDELDIANWANIAGAGIATSDQEIAKHPAVVRAFVRATLRGMADTVRDPNQAFSIAARAVPIKSQILIQRAVLARTVDFLKAEKGHPLGWIDPKVWTETARLLYLYKQLPHQVSATQFYTNRFVTGH